MMAARLVESAGRGRFVFLRQGDETMSKNQHLKPSGLHNNPAYSHVVVASGARTIYISGQVATDEEGGWSARAISPRRRPR